MASRRFFGYDPYDDYYYATPPSNYPYPSYYHHRPQQQQPASARAAGGFFPAAEPVAVRPRPAAKVEATNPAPRARTVSIPVHFVGSDPEPAAAAPKIKKRAPPSAEAAVRVQAAARGFLARRAVRALRTVERDAAEIGEKVSREAAALRGDGRARVAVGEQLMRLLLRLDAVRGARDYRRRVARKVLALQDAVDALEPRLPAPAAAAEEKPESEVTEAEADEVTQAMEPAEVTAVMEVDGDRTADEPCAADETEQAADETDGPSNDDDVSEGEWEMVTEEPAPAAEAEASAEPPRPEPAVEVRKSADDGGLDAKKVMEMVAALCERSAQQCVVIGALAERVDALERAVRRMEEAERRRRRAKKLKKEGKGSNQNKCYID